MKKLLRDGLLVESDNGYKLPSSYYDLADTSSGNGGYFGCYIIYQSANN